MFATRDGLKNRPHRHFRFTVADVPYQEAIHRPRLFHVPLDLFDAPQLVAGFVIGEVGVKLCLQIVIRGEGIALGGLPLGVQVDELVGNILHLGFHPPLRLRPLIAAQAVDPRRPGFRRNILLDQVKLGHRHKNLRVVPVVDNHVVLVDTINFHRLDAAEDTNPVIDMDHVVTRLEVGVALDSFRIGQLLSPVPPLLDLLEQFPLRDDDQAGRGHLKAVIQARSDQLDGVDLELVSPRFDRWDTEISQCAGNLLAAFITIRQNNYRLSLLSPPLQLRFEQRHLSKEPLHRPTSQLNQLVETQAPHSFLEQGSKKLGMAVCLD